MSGVKVDVRRHKVAAGGVADGMTRNVTVAVRLAPKNESSSAWFCDGRRRDELPSSDGELAVEKRVIRRGPLSGIWLAKCLLEGRRIGRG